MTNPLFGPQHGVFPAHYFLPHAAADADAGSIELQSTESAAAPRTPAPVSGTQPVGQDSTSKQFLYQARIIIATMTMLSVLYPLLGYGDEKGKEFVAGSKKFRAITEELESAFASRDAHWQGAAAGAYANQLRDLHDQLQLIASGDDAMRGHLINHAPYVVLARATILGSIAGLALCIPLAVALFHIAGPLQSVVIQMALCAAAMASATTTLVLAINHSKETAAKVNKVVAGYLDVRKSADQIGSHAPAGYAASVMSDSTGAPGRVIRVEQARRAEALARQLPIPLPLPSVTGTVSAALPPKTDVALRVGVTPQPGTTTGLGQATQQRTVEKSPARPLRGNSLPATRAKSATDLDQTSSGRDGQYRPRTL